MAKIKNNPAEKHECALCQRNARGGKFRRWWLCSICLSNYAFIGAKDLAVECNAAELSRDLAEPEGRHDADNRRH